MPQPTLLDRLGFASEAEFYASLRRDGPIAPEPPPPHPPADPAPQSLPPRIAAGWPARVRACPHRTPIDRPSTCGCQEPALCGLGKTDEGRDVVSIDRTCRQCVQAGGPPPAS